MLRATLAGYQKYEHVDLILKEGTRVVEDIVLTATAGAVARRRTARVEGRGDEALPAGAGRAVATTHANGGFFRPPHDTEDYHHFNDNRFLTVGANPLSTFAIDVDAASYANVRRFLTAGPACRPPTPSASRS